MKRSFLLLLPFIVVFCFTHCTERLSKADYEWMPYKSWEVLVFESNEGETDTLFLLRKDTSTSNPGEYGTNSTYEYVDIDYRHREYWDREDTADYGWTSLITVSASKSGSRLAIYFTAKDAHFYGGIYPTIDSLNQVQPKKLRTSFDSYNDVYVFRPAKEDEEEHGDQSSYITKLYWSKSEGVVRYNKKGGEYWVLSKKYKKKDRRFSDY